MARYRNHEGQGWDQKSQAQAPTPWAQHPVHSALSLLDECVCSHQQGKKLKEGKQIDKSQATFKWWLTISRINLF